MNKEDLEHLARLSRLALTEEEKEHFAKEVEGVLSYVSDIQKAAGDLDAAPKAGVLRNVMREDAHPHESGAHTEELLSASKNRKDGYIKVKKILGNS